MQAGKMHIIINIEFHETDCHVSDVDRDLLVMVHTVMIKERVLKHQNYAIVMPDVLLEIIGRYQNANVILDLLEMVLLVRVIVI